MKTLRFLLAALAPMFLAACGGSSTGKVSLLLTDASGQFSAAVVTITEIDLVGSGSWVMHPVMTATEFELSGTVNVTLALGAGVTLPGTVTLGQFSAVLTNSAGSAKTLAFADAGGGTFAASFPYLIPGAYALTLTAPAGVTSFTTSPAVPVAVTVASGQPTAEAFVVTAAH